MRVIRNVIPTVYQMRIKQMMEDVGFENVTAKVVFPGMATIWEGTKAES